MPSLFSRTSSEKNFLLTRLQVEHGENKSSNLQDHRRSKAIVRRWVQLAHKLPFIASYMEKGREDRQGPMVHLSIICHLRGTIVFAELATRATVLEQHGKTSSFAKSIVGWEKLFEWSVQIKSFDRPLRVEGAALHPKTIKQRSTLSFHQRQRSFNHLSLARDKSLSSKFIVYQVNFDEMICWEGLVQWREDLSKAIGGLCLVERSALSNSDNSTKQSFHFSRDFFDLVTVFLLLESPCSCLIHRLFFHDDQRDCFLLESRWQSDIKKSVQLTDVSLQWKELPSHQRCSGCRVTGTISSLWTSQSSKMNFPLNWQISSEQRISSNDLLRERSIFCWQVNSMEDNCRATTPSAIQISQNPCWSFRQMQHFLFTEQNFSFTCVTVHLSSNNVELRFVREILLI